MLKKVDSDALDRAVALVAGHPGASYAAAAKLLGGRRSTARDLLRQAVAAGLIHEGTSHVAVRIQGAVRSVRGLFVGAAPSVSAAPAPVSDGQQLRALREGAQVSQARLSAQLGVSRFLINHWEAGRQGMPAWVGPNLSEALEAAQHPTPSRRRRPVARREAVMDVIKASEGQGPTRRQLRGRTHLTHEAVRRILDQLIAAGAVHEAPTVYTGAAGQRFGVGVFLGPARPWPVSPTPRALHEAGQRAGWGGARIARALGISPEAWSYRLSHTFDQELPGVLGPKASEALQAMTEGSQRFERDLMAAITRAPTTREQLTRGTFGRSSMVEDTIDRMLSAQRLHKGYARLVNAAGVARNIEVLRPGPAPDVEPMSAAELIERRQLAGLSRPQLARHLGVSKVQVGHWETGRQPITARADELRALLDELGIADVPHLDLTRHTDSELEQIVQQLLTETPGQTRRVLTTAMPGDVQRRHATVLRLVASGHLVERVERRARSDGVPFTATVLYVAPGPNT